LALDHGHFDLAALQREGGGGKKNKTVQAVGTRSSDGGSSSTENEQVKTKTGWAWSRAPKKVIFSLPQPLLKVWRAFGVLICFSILQCKGSPPPPSARKPQLNLVATGPLGRATRGRRCRSPQLGHPSDYRARCPHPRGFTPRTGRLSLHHTCRSGTLGERLREPPSGQESASRARGAVPGIYG